VGSGIASRREALFRETKLDVVRRVALGTAWALRPKRLGHLLPLARLYAADLMAPQAGLPDPNIPPSQAEFAGIARDLDPVTLIAAYRRGLFPKTHFGPLKWMSPESRCVLYFDAYHISRRMRAILRQEKFTTTFDRDFEGVIKACAGPRSGHWHLTWITPRIMRAYAALYDAGFVHSFEVWNRQGELVGGGYGVVVNGVFCIESQFSAEANSSKFGFSVLNWHLAKWGFTLSDNKWSTPTTLQMGFRTIPRAAFLRHLADGIGHGGGRGRWEVEDGSRTVADWNAETRPG
jgi:leucyl/phenylalanyl-tRNA--protein transferase